MEGNEARIEIEGEEPSPQISQWSQKRIFSINREKRNESICVNCGRNMYEDCTDISGEEITCGSTLELIRDIHTDKCKHITISNRVTDKELNMTNIGDSEAIIHFEMPIDLWESECAPDYKIDIESLKSKNVLTDLIFLYQNDPYLKVNVNEDHIERYADEISPCQKFAADSIMTKLLRIRKSLLLINCMEQLQRFFSEAAKKIIRFPYFGMCLKLNLRNFVNLTFAIGFPNIKSSKRFLELLKFLKSIMWVKDGIFFNPAEKPVVTMFDLIPRSRSRAKGSYLIGTGTSSITYLPVDKSIDQVTTNHYLVPLFSSIDDMNIISPYALWTSYRNRKSLLAFARTILKGLLDNCRESHPFYSFDPLLIKNVYPRFQDKEEDYLLNVIYLGQCVMEDDISIQRIPCYCFGRLYTEGKRTLRIIFNDFVMNFSGYPSDRTVYLKTDVGVICYKKGLNYMMKGYFIPVHISYGNTHSSIQSDFCILREGYNEIESFMN